MEKFAYSDNNIIGLIILLIIFLNIKSNKKKKIYSDELFIRIIFSTSIIIILDIIIDGISGEMGYLMRETHIVLTVLYFLMNPSPYFLWALYVDYYIHKSIRRMKKIMPIFAIPATISIILCVLSIYNRKVYYINEDNIYQRGDLFLVNAGMYYSYCIGTYIQILLKRKSIRKKDYYALLSFGVAPVITGLIQIFQPTKSYLWLGIAISALIIYLNIQNNEINEDYLTGLYNRRQLDRYLRDQLENLEENIYILMVIMDLNFFKSINDTYGHLEGDEALKHTANILGQSFRSEVTNSYYKSIKM